MEPKRVEHVVMVGRCLCCGAESARKGCANGDKISQCLQRGAVEFGK